MNAMHELGADLNLLVVLDVLLEERSVTRAATRLGLTQPAVSHALARLRKQFGDPLLVRGRGGMVPTPRAQALVGPLRLGISQLELVLRHEPHFDPATSRRRFTIASVDYICLTGLGEIIGRLARTAPDVSVELVPVGPRPEEQLESGELDVVLAGVEVEQRLGSIPGMMRSRIVSEDFLCVVRQRHPRVDRGLDLDTYLDLPHVVVSTEDGACDHKVDVLLRELGKTRRVVAAIPHFISAPLIVARSDAIATLPRAVCEAAARMAPVQLHTPPFPSLRGDADLWWHERQTNEPAHRWWRKQMMDAFAPYRSSRSPEASEPRAKQAP